jgi:hypothetical protein
VNALRFGLDGMVGHVHRLVDALDSHAELQPRHHQSAASEPAHLIAMPTPL